MFFVLSKIVYFFLQPFTWLLLFLFVFFFTKSSKWKKRAKITSLFIALFFTNTFVFKTTIHFWEIPAEKIENIAPHDVAIVLGGMFEYDNDAERLSILRSGDRIWQALELYHTKKVRKILISGDHGYVFDRGLHEANQLKELLVGWGIPSDDIIVEPYSRNTYENALESVKILKEEYPEYSRFILVTSAFHMRRSAACFEKQGMTCTLFSTNQMTGTRLHYNWDEFIIPNPYNFENWFVLIKEWVGFIGYKIMGYA